MKVDLSGKNILVTGGAGNGLGQGICEAIDKSGGRIILNDLDEKEAERAAEKYTNAIPLAGDISNSRDVKGMFNRIANTCGIIHGLVNNAGIGLGKYAHEASEEEVNRLIDVDVKGIWLMSKAFVNQLLEAGEAGNIVNISSVQSFSTMPRMALYAGAKSAVNGLTRGLAVELGKHNIRCNAVAPGLVYSDQTRQMIGKWSDDPDKWIEDHKNEHQCLKFLTSARDCGNVVSFLLSDLSRSITGQTLFVDNGTTTLLYNNDFTA